MSGRSSRGPRRKRQFQQTNPLRDSPPAPTKVKSLLDSMQEGKEYQSIVSLVPQNPASDLNIDVQRAIREVERIRERPCVCYVANVVKELPETGISAADHLPFSEMLAQIDGTHTALDIFLVTPGGQAEQVTAFVNELRLRFSDVQFLLPYKAMSAGTLWALSGNQIWMDNRACIGPIDPQVRAKDGSLVPAQSLLTLLDRIQKDGESAISKKQPPPWTYIRLVDNIDHRQLGAAMSASDYSITMAAEFLYKYKFKTWFTHSSTGQEVSDKDRTSRALQVAAELCSHEKWRAHGHAISREIAESELKIQIDHIEAMPGLQSAIRKLWALFYYIFDKSGTVKIITSSTYTYNRSINIEKAR